MSLLESFEPLIGTLPRVLILGSMPGVASLQRQQYYAHPRNLFWPIMSEILGLKWRTDYSARIQQVKSCPVVVWDVLRACEREGSLDSAIRTQQLAANDIPGLVEQYPTLSLIVFNGTAAEKYFRQFFKQRPAQFAHLDLICLPSTSAANAGKNFAQKLHEWRVMQAYLGLPADK